MSITCGFIGLGLIGGSIARAIKEKLPDSTVIAYDINENTLLQARTEQVADIVTSSIDEHFRNCDYIFLCAPVQKNDENLQTVKHLLSPHCLLTDVGSVKADIHRAISEAGLSRQFIGGHPMAGSERVGFVNSKAVLLENAYYILTPTKETPAEMLSSYCELVQTLGAIPLVLEPEQHDYVTAAVSHLPHVIAASLVNLVKDNDSKDGIMKMIAAGGFKDITRIASSSAGMWQQICLTNTENIIDLLKDYIHSLTSVKEALEHRNATSLYELFEAARIYRDSFSNASSGPIKKSYCIRIDIADKPGALASIVALLASHDISIKNIGISHNREAEDGVLQIELYEEASLLKTSELLRAQNYTFH